MASSVNIAAGAASGRLRNWAALAAPSQWSTRYPLLAGWEWVLFMFVASRVIIFTVIAFARMVFVKADIWHPGGIFSVLLQWDAELWYVTIARDGYTYDPDFPSSMGFFPFYPLLIRLFGFVFTDMRVAALVVSHVCLIAAGLIFNALINVDYKDQRINRAAVTFLMFSPVSFFFSHAYTESTFLMLSMGAFLAAFKRQWLIACLLGGCLTATRNVGMLIGLPLFIEYVRQMWDPARGIRSLIHPRILLFALIPMGMAMFSLYGYLKFNEPFAYLQATKVWGREFTSPIRTFNNLRVLPVFYHWYFVSVLVGGLLIYLSAFWFRLRVSYLVYATLLITIYICGASLEAIPRYLTVVFPLFIALGVAAVRYPAAHVPILACFIAILTLSNIMSAVGYWIT
jgi:hypothetical protein